MTPDMISGDALLSVSKPAIRDFLNNGGFLKIYKVNKNRQWDKLKNIGWWIEQVLKKVIPIILATFFGYLIGKKDGQMKFQSKQSSHKEKSVSTSKR
jgi:hypothetical protein